ncbi:MAG TPA: hypothetical protein VFB13_17745 [Reyranella sp.]|nr:hypothetical protein [Reyranella sp.]
MNAAGWVLVLLLLDLPAPPPRNTPWSRVELWTYQSRQDCQDYAQRIAPGLQRALLRCVERNGGDHGSRGPRAGF